MFEWQTLASNLSQRILITTLLTVGLAACSQETVSETAAPETSSNADETLIIWWEKGFNIEEDEALQKLVADWEAESGKDADLSVYTTDDLPQKAQRALQAGNPPDILMSHNAERSLYPRLAWEGRLVDVSDVIEPVKSQYPDAILEAVYFQNQETGERSYYAVPFSQSTNWIFYWRDLVEQAGFQDAEIPTDWDNFWSFWEQVQTGLEKTKSDPKIYGLGFSMSDKAGDTYYLFEQVLEAYGVQILTPEGELQIDEPAVQAGILAALKWYTQFFQAGYMPPGTVNWLNPDNNNELLNRAVVMTPNTSMTIPATVREDPEVYEKKLVTMPFPTGKNGAPTRHILTIKQAVIFTDSEHPEMAKEFLAYLIQPEVLGTYLKSAGIRNLPVTNPVWEDPFWNNPADPHLAVATEVLRSEYTRPFPSVYHPAYSIVTQENVWGQAINRIVVEGVPPEQAAQDAIARVKEIFDQWE